MVTRNQAIAVCLVAALFTSPIWVPWVLGFIPQAPVGPQGIPVFKVTDGNTDAAFSPADASLKVYDPRDLREVPLEDVLPLLYVDTASESPDGEFTLTRSLPIDSWMYVYITGTNYYTAGFFCKVPDLRAGTTGECEPIALKVYPNSGTIGNDIAAMLTSSGSEVDDQDATANVTFGVATYTLDLTAASGYAFGNAPHLDAETGYAYRSTFVMFDLTLTTARMTLDCPDTFEHFTINTHEYWIIDIGQIINDAQITGDGTASITVNIEVTVGADDALAIDFYTTRRPSQIRQASCGTSYESDNLATLNLATS